MVTNFDCSHQFQYFFIFLDVLFSLKKIMNRFKTAFPKKKSLWNVHKRRDYQILYFWLGQYLNNGFYRTSKENNSYLYALRVANAQWASCWQKSNTLEHNGSNSLYWLDNVSIIWRLKQKSAGKWDISIFIRVFMGYFGKE